jgi:hypothetical protein
MLNVPDRFLTWVFDSVVVLRLRRGRFVMTRSEAFFLPSFYKLSHLQRGPPATSPKSDRSWKRPSGTEFEISGILSRPPSSGRCWLSPHEDVETSDPLGGHRASTDVTSATTAVIRGLPRRGKRICPKWINET